MKTAKEVSIYDQSTNMYVSYIVDKNHILSIRYNKDWTYIKYTDKTTIYPTQNVECFVNYE